MPLTTERIAKLATKKGCKPVAVSNFLGSLGDMKREDAFLNLEQDARSYGWNAATTGAIRTGLLEHYKR